MLQNLLIIFYSIVPVRKSVTPPPMQQSRGSSAYNYFTQEMHLIVYAQYSNLKPQKAEGNKLLGKMWSKMSEVKKS